MITYEALPARELRLATADLSTDAEAEREAALLTRKSLADAADLDLRRGDPRPPEEEPHRPMAHARGPERDGPLLFEDPERDGPHRTDRASPLQEAVALEEEQEAAQRALLLRTSTQLGSVLDTLASDVAGVGPEETAWVRARQHAIARGEDPPPLPPATDLRFVPRAAPAVTAALTAAPGADTPSAEGEAEPGAAAAEGPPREPLTEQELQQVLDAAIAGSDAALATLHLRPALGPSAFRDAKEREAAAAARRAERERAAAALAEAEATKASAAFDALSRRRQPMGAFVAAVIAAVALHCGPMADPERMQLRGAADAKTEELLHQQRHLAALQRRYAALREQLQESARIQRLLLAQQDAAGTEPHAEAAAHLRAVAMFLGDDDDDDPPSQAVLQRLRAVRGAAGDGEVLQRRGPQQSAAQAIATQRRLAVAQRKARTLRAELLRAHAQLEARDRGEMALLDHDACVPRVRPPSVRDGVGCARCDELLAADNAVFGADDLVLPPLPPPSMPPGPERDAMVAERQRHVVELRRRYAAEAVGTAERVMHHVASSADEAFQRLLDTVESALRAAGDGATSPEVHTILAESFAAVLAETHAVAAHQRTELFEHVAYALADRSDVISRAVRTRSHRRLTAGSLSGTDADTDDDAGRAPHAALDARRPRLRESRRRRTTRLTAGPGCVPLGERDLAVDLSSSDSTEEEGPARGPPAVPAAPTAPAKPPGQDVGMARVAPASKPSPPAPATGAVRAVWEYSTDSDDSPRRRRGTRRRKGKGTGSPAEGGAAATPGHGHDAHRTPERRRRRARPRITPRDSPLGPGPMGTATPAAPSTTEHPKRSARREAATRGRARGAPGPTAPTAAVLPAEPTSDGLGTGPPTAGAGPLGPRSGAATCRRCGAALRCSLCDAGPAPGPAVVPSAAARTARAPTADGPGTTAAASTPLAGVGDAKAGASPGPRAAAGRGSWSGTAFDPAVEAMLDRGARIKATWSTRHHRHREAAAAEQLSTVAYDHLAAIVNDRSAAASPRVPLPALSAEQLMAAAVAQGAPLHVVGDGSVLPSGHWRTVRSDSDDSGDGERQRLRAELFPSAGPGSLKESATLPPVPASLGRASPHPDDRRRAAAAYREALEARPEPLLTPLPRPTPHRKGDALRPGNSPGLPLPPYPTPALASGVPSPYSAPNPLDLFGPAADPSPQGPPPTHAVPGPHAGPHAGQPDTALPALAPVVRRAEAVGSPLASPGPEGKRPRMQPLRAGLSGDGPPCFETAAEPVLLTAGPRRRCSRSDAAVGRSRSRSVAPVDTAPGPGDTPRDHTSSAFGPRPRSHGGAQGPPVAAGRAPKTVHRTKLRQPTPAVQSLAKSAPR